MRRRQLRVVRDSWLFFVAYLAVGALMVAVAALLVRTSFARGFAVGAGSAIVLAGAVIGILVVSGTASALMGSVGEQWTASELRKLRQLGWFVVNHVTLKVGDIDHVLIGPGGVIAVETKWSRDGWRLEPASHWVSNALAQAAGNARDLFLWVGRPHGLPHVLVTVFLWSAEEPDVDRTEVLYREGAAVILGARAAETWRAKVATLPTVLDETQIQEIREVLVDQVRRRDSRDAQFASAIPTYSWIYWTAFGTLVASFSGLLACLEIARTGVPALWLPAQLGLIGAGLVARRWKPARWVALGWVAGSAFASVATWVLEATIGN